jgi:hypothetical protein
VNAANNVPEPALLVMSAWPALLVSAPPGVPKNVPPPFLFVMMALPAVLASKKFVVPPLLVIMALAAEA